MNDLVLVPTMATSRRFDFSDAEVIEPINETVEVPNHFIEANTVAVSLEHLANDCVPPVFAKDNELTINHVSFIRTVEDAVKDFFRGEQVNDSQIRASHIIKGRIPSAIHKPVSQLLESDKTIYYERCAFSIDVPTIYQDINGNRPYLSVVGVRAYNTTPPEHRRNDIRAVNLMHQATHSSLSCAVSVSVTDSPSVLSAGSSSFFAPRLRLCANCASSFFRSSL